MLKDEIDKKAVTSQITFEHIFNATSKGVIVTDAKGLIVHINRQAERILQLTCCSQNEKARRCFQELIRFWINKFLTS